MGNAEKSIGHFQKGNYPVFFPGMFWEVLVLDSVTHPCIGRCCLGYKKEGDFLHLGETVSVLVIVAFPRYSSPYLFTIKTDKQTLLED